MKETLVLEVVQNSEDTLLQETFFNKDVGLQQGFLLTKTPYSTDIFLPSIYTSSNLVGALVRKGFL